MSDLLLEPSQISFEGIQAGVTYVIEAKVQNVSMSLRKVRLIPPKTEHFQAKLSSMVSIPPGLSVTLSVYFTAPTAGRPYYDTMGVKDNTGNIMEIPLQALPPHPQFQCSPSLDFGILTLGQSTSQELTIRNTGSASGIFSLLYDQPTPLVEGESSPQADGETPSSSSPVEPVLSVSPESCRLDPGQSEK
ncbi:hypothetical protein KIPB_009578, partial [Kipferlia bialata]|eukprot:g9578.t1